VPKWCKEAVFVHVGRGSGGGGYGQSGCVGRDMVDRITSYGKEMLDHLVAKEGDKAMAGPMKGDMGLVHEG